MVKPLVIAVSTFVAQLEMSDQAFLDAFLDEQALAAKAARVRLSALVPA